MNHFLMIKNVLLAETLRNKVTLKESVGRWYFPVSLYFFEFTNPPPLPEPAFRELAKFVFETTKPTFLAI